MGIKIKELWYDMIWSDRFNRIWYDPIDLTETSNRAVTIETLKLQIKRERNKDPIDIIK